MAEETKKVVKVKVVDRRENKPKKNSLVLKAKKQSTSDAEKIKKLNEATAAKKQELVKKEQASQADNEISVTTTVEQKPVAEMDVGHKYSLSIDLKDYWERVVIWVIRLQKLILILENLSIPPKIMWKSLTYLSQKRLWKELVITFMD